MSLLQNGKEDLAHEDLNKLPFLERCLKETLRLFPPGPMTGRSLNEGMHMSKTLEIEYAYLTATLLIYSQFGNGFF